MRGHTLPTRNAASFAVQHSASSNCIFERAFLSQLVNKQSHILLEYLGSLYRSRAPSRSRYRCHLQYLRRHLDSAYRPDVARNKPGRTAEPFFLFYSVQECKSNQPNYRNIYAQISLTEPVASIAFFSCDVFSSLAYFFLLSANAYIQEKHLRPSRSHARPFHVYARHAGFHSSFPRARARCAVPSSRRVLTKAAKPFTLPYSTFRA